MTPAEVWTLLSILGAAVAVWGAFDAYHDYRAANRGNGVHIAGVPPALLVNVLSLEARGYLRGERIHAVVMLAWASAGAWVLWTDRSSQWAFPAGVLVGTLVLLVLRSLLDARDRLRVRRALHPPPPE